jgi:hypothetical protein
MGQIQFVGSLLLIALFSIAVVNFGIGFGNDNNAAVKLSDDVQLSGFVGNVESDIVTFKSDTNASQKALFDSTIASGDETTTTGGQFKGGISGILSSIKNIITLGYNKIFGSEQGTGAFGIVLTGFISFLVFIMGMYIWKTWAGKNPD